LKTFEIFSESKKKGQNGRRKFKVILYRIFPDSCIDEANEVGTEYNLNGITWIKEYCEKALPSIKGMFLRCEFLDEDRTELCGHGMTDTVDGVPIFENATTIGTFTDGYIDEIEEDGEKIMVCIGVGEIDSNCYHNFCEKLDENIANGIYPQGSVEIMRTAENDGIVYKYGYKDKGRIPTEFIHSGYALLGVTPSDNSAKLVELNEKNNDKKEETKTMTDVEINALVEQIVSKYTDQVNAIAQCKSDCDSKIAEMNSTIETVTGEKNELTGTVEQLKEALEKVRNDYTELNAKYEELWKEREALEKALAEAQAKERIGEMNAAIANFSDDEVAYAQAEIDAFKADPVASEINSVVNKIYEGIGKNKKAADAQVASEQNAAANTQIEDIFSAVASVATAEEDVNIF
jgi:phage shock protein A